MLLTTTQVSRLLKDFINGSSANIKLSKTQLHKIGESRRILGRLLRPLVKTGLSLMKNLLKPLAECVVILLGLLAAAAAAVTDGTIHKKMFDQI